MTTKVVQASELKIGDRVTKLANADITAKFRTVKSVEKVRRGVLAISIDRGWSWFVSPRDLVTILVK